jgi:hypothetical protein
VTVTSNKWGPILLCLLVYIPFLNSYGFDLLFTKAIDFPSFYTAPILAFERDAVPYNRDEWDRAQNESSEKLWPFLYPPPSLLLFRPLNAFTYDVAKNVMLVANHLLVLVFIHLCVVKILGLTFVDATGAFAVVYILLSWPLLGTLHAGQVNLLVVVLVCLTWFLFKKNVHPALTALPVSLAILIKVYPALLLPYFFMKGRAGVAYWAVILVILVSAITLPVLPNDTWQEWYRNVAGKGYAETIGETEPWNLSNQSVNGFTARLFQRSEYGTPAPLPSETAARVVPYAIAGIVLLMSFTILSLCSRKKRHDDIIDHEVSLVLLAATIVAPISWEHHYVFIVPACLVALRHVVSNPVQHTHRVLVILATFVIAFSFPFSRRLFAEGLYSLLVSVKLYAAILLWLFFVVTLWRLAMQRPEPGTQAGRVVRLG